MSIETLVNVVLVAINVGILALSLKLYTEYVKGWAMDQRGKK